MAGKCEEQMKEITERLEQGVKELFTSEKYTAYLKTMAQFHSYSFNNTVLIMMQKPDATLVAGYSAWKKKFNRQVKRGEKGIQIMAPVPVKIREEVEKFDPETDEPVLRSDGQPETEVVEHVILRFRATTVFDISQTEGDPLPEIDAPELMGSVENFKIFMEAIRMASPVPMRYGHTSGESKGFYSSKDKEIVIREGMSERHTMKTAVHEVTHAMCHDRDLMLELGEQKGQMTREVEAESVAYTVCQYFGLDTSDYSFPYIAGWSSDMDMKELRSSMEFIRKTAGSLIDSISGNIQAIQREQPEKGHLKEDDLILKVVFPLTGMFTYMVVENMDREELLAQLQSYHELYGKSDEMTVETFLEGQGARLIPWYDSASLMAEKPVRFFDFEYEYDTGTVDAEALPTEEWEEMLISRAEYQGTAFDGQDRDLIKEYAKKFDDMDAVKGLIWELAGAKKDSDIQAVQRIRSHARAEMDKFPDKTLGFSAMHWMGCHDDSMLPLTRERALELYCAGLDIYSLQADGRTFLMALEGDFYEEKGIFGVKAEEWESYRELEAEPEPAYESRETQELGDRAAQEAETKTAQQMDGMEDQDAGSGREYQEVEIFEVPALFSNGRVPDSEIPAGFYRYELRGSDYDSGEPVTVENNVTVNHAGTILALHPLPMPERGFLKIGEGLNFTGGMTAAEQFRSRAAGLDAAELEEKTQNTAIRSNEELLYTDKADRYAIFHINENGKGREYLFMDFTYAKKSGMEITGHDYGLVYGGILHPQENLDTIYKKFNQNRPEGYKGHSLSTSDVVVISRGGQARAYYIDSIGVAALSEFVDERKQVLGRAAVQPEESLYPPVYTHTLDYAMEHASADAYLDSRKLNLDCKRAVEDAILEKFDGMRLAHDAAAPVLKEYGPERVTFVLASTVQHLSGDGRFSKENRAWAESFAIPENTRNGMDLNADYTVSSHPAVLDGFIGLAREEMREQERLRETGMQINEGTRGFSADGHFGTWHTADVKEVNKEPFYLMEHDEYGDLVAAILVSRDGKVVAEDLEDGFGQEALDAVHEYFAENGIPEGQEMPFIAQYYVMHDNTGGERECQYFESLNAAVIAYHQLPNHLDKQIGMESTEQPPSRMSLIECRNGMDTLTDIESCSLSGKWVRGETMEASEKAGKYLEGCYKEIAYRTGKGYFSIQTVSDGYDYTIYDRNFREIDGGVYDNPDISINEAMEDILSDAGIPMGACKAMDYEELQEKTGAAAQEDLKKAQDEMQDEKPPLISGQTDPEPALNGQSRAEIEETVLCYAQAQIDEMGLSGEVELIGARVYGSRSREGMYQEGSDVDVALSYSGSIREDAFFNALHEGSFEIAGIPVDINPISTEKTGTLDEYLEDADRYLDEKRWQELTGEIVKFSMDYGEDLLGFWDGTAEIETESIYQAHEIIYNALARSDTGKFQAHLEEVLKINDAGSPAAEDAARLLEKITGKRMEPPERDAKISFYVAECMEFPVLGEYHENIETLQEAMELYEKIPADRMNGVKGIGFCLEDGSAYAGKFELMSGREMLTDIINDIPHYKESPLVQKVVAEMEAILSGQEPRSAPDAVKEPGLYQKPVVDPEPLQKPEKKPETEQEPEAHIDTISNTQIPAFDTKAAPGEVKTKAAVRQKVEEKAHDTGTGRGASGSRKQSVLNALRERQARMKAQEKQGQKAQAHKKGGQEL